MLKVGGIYNDTKINGYSIILDEDEDYIFGIDFDDDIVDNSKKTEIENKINELIVNLHCEDFFKLKFWNLYRKPDYEEDFIHNLSGYLGVLDARLLQTLRELLQESMIH